MFNLCSINNQARCLSQDELTSSSAWISNGGHCQPPLQPANLTRRSSRTLPPQPTVHTGYLYRIALTGALAGLLFGFDTAVINGALLSLRTHFALSELQVEFAASSLLYGCLFGAMAAGTLSDRYGRRSMLRLSGMLFLFSAIFAAVPATFTEFLLARFLGGLGIGFASTIAPLYLAEVSPKEKRGSIVTLNQTAIVSGMLLAYCTNWALAVTGAAAWRWMFGAAAVPALAFILCLHFVPESPRWLFQQDRVEEADAAFCAIGGEACRSERLEEIRDAIALETPAPGWLRRLRRPLLFAVGVAMLQQITGINTVLYYGSMLFVAHGNSGSDQRAFAANVLIGLSNLVFTLIALCIMDRIGRRTLLTGSASVMCAALLLLVFQFHRAHADFAFIVSSTMLYTAAFSMGLGPGAWLYIAEIFPTYVRGRAMSIATAVLWASCILVSNSFLTMVRALGPAGAFGVFAGICAFAALFFSRLPETLGRSLEEIENSWKP
jgi:sugar porter (SP) family MFS transporter